MKVHKILPVFISLTFIFFSRCDTTEPPDNKTLTLNLEDISCTETWLTLTTTNIQLPASINILKNDNVAQTISLNTADTLLYIDSLLPHTNYKFQVSVTQGDQTSGILSNKITATTMDTTSHDFTWQTWTFGGGGEASSINDVTIIDENNIWACGEIYLPDSLGNPDEIPYNVIHWDGQDWKPQKVTINFRGFLITPVLEGIFAFAPNQIWLAGGLAIYGDGNNWTPYDVRLITGYDYLTLSKCWGVNSEQMYFIGMVGSIAIYQNGKWKRIESGTRTYINDVWGIVDDNNEVTAYCPVSSFFTPGDKKILRIKNSQVDSVSWNMDRLLYSIWTNNERYLYVCGSGVFENKKGNWKEIDITSVASNRIRGNGLNDIFVIGDYGFTAHYNGIGWYIFDNLFDFNSGLKGVAIKKNTVVIVGQRDGFGIVAIGRRN